MKEAVKIPVIGNGDVTSARLAADMRKQTGCDGVMIGRGAQGNPRYFDMRDCRLSSRVSIWESGKCVNTQRGIPKE